MQKTKLLSVFPVVLLLTASGANAAVTTVWWGGGSSGIADNTATPTTGAAFEGTWDTTTSNWASGPYSPNTYGTWVDGSSVFLGRRGADGGTPADPDITLTGSINAAGLISSSIVNTTNNLLIDLTAASAVTIGTGSSGYFPVRTFVANASSGIRLLSNVTLTGSATLLKDGTGEFRLSGNNNAFTGKVLAIGGGINLASSASIAGVTDITLGGQRVSMTDWGRSGNSGWMSGSITVTSANNAGNDQLADNAVITLARGIFDYRPGGANSVETIGKIVLAPTGSVLSSQGTTGGTLILSDPTQGIQRDATGTMIVNTVNASTDPTLRTNVRVTNTGSIPTDTLLPWAPTNFGSYTYIDSTDNNTLKAYTAVNSDTDLSVWNTTYGSADIVRVNSATATNTIDGNTTVRALTFSSAFNTAVTLTLDPGVTLNVAAGGIYSQGSGNVTRAITGGDLTTSAGQFFISTGNSNTTNLAINSRLTGSYDLVKSGVVPLVLGGPDANTFLGDTHVMEGLLTLNKTAVGGVAPAAVNGDVYVATGAGLNLGTNGSLPSTSDLFLSRDGLLNIANTVTYGGVLTSNGGQIGFLNMAPVFNNAGTGLVLNGGYWQHNSTSTGTLNLQTNVSYAPSSTRQMRFERYNTGAFNIELDGAERTFAIADSATLAAGVAEMVIDTTIVDGSPAGGSLRKTGLGTLQLIGANAYTGGTTVDEGVLQLSTISAPEQTGLIATGTGAGNLSNVLTFDKPIATPDAFVVGQTVSGLPSTRRVTGILNDYQIMVNGTTTTGTYTVSVDAVSRTGSLQGNVTVNNTGTLQIDSGSSVAGAVTVNAGGTLAGSGSVGGGADISGSVAPGSSIGQLNVTGNVTWNGAANGGNAWKFELGAGNTADLLAITGDFLGTIAGGTVFMFDFQGATVTGTFKLVDWSGTTNFLASSFSYTNLGGGNTGSFAIDGTNSWLTFTAAPVPEPATLAAALGAFALLFALRRRRIA